MITDQIKALNRQRRDARVSGARDKLRKTDRRYWYYGAVVLLGAGVVVGCRNYLGFQRDTALALADTRNGLSAPEATAPEVQVVGMPNPLQSLALSSQAMYILGGRYKQDDEGRTTGEFTDLPPNRSAAVVSKLLANVDLCTVYVSLGAKTEVVVTFEPTPGAVPLLGSEQCAPPAYVPTPQDPMPTTTVAPT